MNITVILLAAVAAVVGICLGALVVFLIIGSRHTEADTPDAEPEEERDTVLLRLLSPAPGGKPVLEWQGKQYGSAAALPDGERERMQTLLRPWLSTPDLPHAMPFQAIPSAWDQEPKPVMSSIPAAAAAVNAVAGAVAPRPFSIVDQIEEVFQELLAESPLAGRDIHLGAMGSEGVAVWVGSQRFDSIDTVTDPEVKELLRRSVAEWEKRSL